jgi:hypothetical protein
LYMVANIAGTNSFTAAASAAVTGRAVFRSTGSGTISIGRVGAKISVWVSLSVADMPRI